MLIQSGFQGKLWRHPVRFHAIWEDGRHKCCHQDQLCPRVVGNGPPEMFHTPLDEDVPISLPVSAESAVETPPVAAAPDQGSGPPQVSRHSQLSTQTSSSDSDTHQYPHHQRKPGLQNCSNQGKTETAFFVRAVLCNIDACMSLFCHCFFWLCKPSQGGRNVIDRLVIK